MPSGPHDAESGVEYQRTRPDVAASNQMILKENGGQRELRGDREKNPLQINLLSKGESPAQSRA